MLACCRFLRMTAHHSCTPLFTLIVHGLYALCKGRLSSTVIGVNAWRFHFSDWCHARSLPVIAVVNAAPTELTASQNSAKIASSLYFRGQFFTQSKMLAAAQNICPKYLPKISVQLCHSTIELLHKRRAVAADLHSDHRRRSL